MIDKKVGGIVQDDAPLSLITGQQDRMSKERVSSRTGRFSSSLALSDPPRRSAGTTAQDGLASFLRLSNSWCYYQIPVKRIDNPAFRDKLLWLWFFRQMLDLRRNVQL